MVGDGKTNWLSDIFSNIDAWIISGEEATAAHNLGIKTPGCTCDVVTTYEYTKDDHKYTLYEGKDEDGNTEYYYKIWTSPFTMETVMVDSDDTGIDFDTATSKINNPCSNCVTYLKFLFGKMQKQSDDTFETYTPYIESVQNHWFRDVYFVEKDKNDAGNSIDGFIDYDYQYELITGERWTLYETDSNGDFVYYKMNDDGSTSNEIYTGKVISGEFAVTDENGNVQTDSDGNIVTERLANRGEDGTLVVKKAVLVDDLEDLGWNESEWGNMIAYDPEIQDPVADYEPMYSEKEIADKSGGDELKADALKHLYIELAITNVTQTGEGLRTETNPKIKKMFMANNYFKYDGSRQRAEIIYALRKASGVEYGPIDDGMLNNEYELTFSEEKYTSEAEDGKYKLGDYVGNVSFQQDALNTFAMLENSHTIDSDYIYKDFKELVVELGYFDKEELTESKPKLLQWVVPEIGSAGFPDRSIDKNEAEYGTMVHSKMDIEANEKNKISAIIEKMSAKEPEKGNVAEPVSSITQVKGIQQNLNTETDDILSSSSSNVNLRNVKGTGAKLVFERVEESGEGYKTVVKSGNVKYLHRYQGGQPYSDTQFYWGGESTTSSLGDAACGLFSCFNVLTGYGYEFDPAKELAGYKWPATMAAVKDLMEEKGVSGQFIDNTDTATLDQALNEGRPAILLFAGNAVDKQGICWTTCGHFVALVGKDASGNILTLDSAARK